MKRFLKSFYQVIPFKKNVFLVIKRFFNLSPSTYKHLHFRGVFKVNVDTVHHFLIMHNGYLIENEVFWRGLYNNSWERVSLQYWVQLCKHSKKIMDVGANTGIYSLIAKAVNKESVVIAYEPAKRIYDMLCRNNELNNFDIKCVEKIVSNFNGHTILFDDLSSDHSYSATVNKEFGLCIENVAESKIECVKLETFIQENKMDAIDLIKIDVERHEPEVLEGLGKYLGLFQPTLLIEILNDDIAMKVERIVEGIPYLFFNINETEGARMVHSLSKSDGYNFLLCKKNVALKLGLIS